MISRSAIWRAARGGKMAVGAFRTGERLSLSFMGLAFARAWLAILFASPTSQGYGAVYATTLFDVAYVVCAVLALACVRRIVPLTARRWSWIAPLVLMEAASLLFVAGQVELLDAQAAFVASSVSGGAGFLAFCLYSAEVLATQSLRHVMMYLALGPVLSFALTFFLADGSFEHTALALVALPVVAVGLSVHGLSLVPDQLRQKDAFPRFSMPWLLIAFLSVYAFVYGLHQGELAPGVGRYSSPINAAVGLILALWVVFLSGRMSLRPLYAMPVVLMICGFVLVSLEGIITAYVADVFIVGAFAFAILIVSFMFYDMSKRLGIPVVVFSAAFAATNVFGVAGRLVADTMAALPAYAPVVSAVTYVAIAALAVLLGYAVLADRTLFEHWGIRLKAAGEPGAAQRSEAAVRRSRAFAEEHGLTAREAEVLALVAEGLTSREVQDRLFIAEGTFKTHMRHIYEKSGVHGQKRLRQLLAEGNGAASE